MGVSIISTPQYPLAEVALSLLPAPLGLGLLLAPLDLLHKEVAPPRLHHQCRPGAS